MNITNTENVDDSNPIFIYIMLIIEVINALISAWTSYKLGHFEMHANHVKICCCEFDNIDIEVSDSESNTGGGDRNSTQLYPKEDESCRTR
jgi:hypothetical protein